MSEYLVHKFAIHIFIISIFFVLLRLIMSILRNMQGIASVFNHCCFFAPRIVFLLQSVNIVSIFEQILSTSYVFIICSHGVEVVWRLMEEMKIEPNEELICKVSSNLNFASSGSNTVI